MTGTAEKKKLPSKHPYRWELMPNMKPIYLPEERERSWNSLEDPARLKKDPRLSSREGTIKTG